MTALACEIGRERADQRVTRWSITRTPIRECIGRARFALGSSAGRCTGAGAGAGSVPRAAVRPAARAG